jgi:hypothetical protein
MMRVSSSVVAIGLSATVALTPSCATPTPALATSPKAVVSDPEVVLLRERVARLEKRLADVDGKLALLLARADASAAAPPPSTILGAQSAPGPLSLGRRADRPDRPDGPSSSSVPEGLASIDIGPASSGDAVVSIDDGGIIERSAVSLEAEVYGEPGPSTSPPLVSSPPLRDGAGDVGGDEASDEAGVVVVGEGDDVLASMQSARELYAWAQARLKEARYLEAVAGFEEIALRFPKDDLADNSLYWIGVCHQGRGEHRLAIAEWQKLPARFPKSPKIPDALFGMAQSHEALLEPAVAEVLYDEVVGSYPKAEKYKEAKKAIARLRPPMPGPR